VDSGHVLRIDAHIERQTHPFAAKFPEPLLYSGGVLECCTADHHTRHATFEQRSGCAVGTHATADLQTQTRSVREVQDLRSITEFTIAGPVEIDHVQPGGAKIAITPSELCGIKLVAGLGRKVALQQADTLATA
jgi:hypothetical protein